VELTAAGRQLLKGARELFAKRVEVINSTKRAAGGESGVLRLGAAASAAFGVIAELIRAFQAKHSEVSVQLDEREADPMISGLLTGEVDVAIIRGPFSHAELTTRLLLREPLQLVIPSHHALADVPEIDLSALAEEPFMLFPRYTAPAFHDTITSVFVGAGFSPSITQEAHSWASVVGLVGAGLGFTIAPASAAAIKSDYVVFKAIKHVRTEAELLFAYREKSLPPAAERLLEVAREQGGLSAGTGLKPRRRSG
jgi:DNA-binding transcriptional LysR family regulator